jgi:hypothetical protein
MIYDLPTPRMYMSYVVLMSFPWEGGFHILKFETVPCVG